MNKLLTFGTDGDLAHVDRDWHLDALGKFVCIECGGILPSYYPASIDVRLSELPENMSCGPVCGWGRKNLRLSVFATAFLDAIREHLGGFVIGRCFDSDGTLIPTHATCYTRDTLLTRGDTKTQYWSCDACGQRWSYTPPSMPQYVLRSDLGEAMVYKSSSSRLLIVDTLARKLDWTQWPDLDLEWVEIRSSGVTPEFVTAQWPDVDLELRDKARRSLFRRGKDE